jgi:acyl transferase domain-containing protein
VAALARAIRARESRRASLAALDVANASLDLQLRYRPSREIDLARRRLWKLRLAIDTAAGDQAAARGDAAVLRWIGDRL